MIGAAVFYILSLLITIPFLRFLSFPIARFASILTLTLISFFLAHFMNFRTAFILTIALLLPIFLRKTNFKNFRLDESEIVFATVFAFFSLLRFMDPSIFDSEKFMDLAIINSILKSPSLPPNDPFLSGAKLDCYYYFGHVLGASIVLLSLSPPEIGYNIAVASLPAYTATMIYGIFKENRKFAIIAVLLTIFSGNAYSFLDFISRPFSLDYLYYWNSTRVIKGTINEFPYFSFIHADLHAHVFAIPMKTFLIALMLKNIKNFMLPATLFAIFATNPWDFPFSMFLVVLFSAFSREKKPIIYSSLSLIPVAFYYDFMNLPRVDFFISAERTDLLQFLSYSATILALAFFSLEKKALYSIPISLPLYFISPIIPLLVPICVSALISRDKSSPLMLTGAIAFIFPDFIVIDSRMNTVFKLYLTAWLFVSIGALIKLKEIKNGKKKAIIAVLLIIGLTYPIVATPIRYHSAAFSFDGMKFTEIFGEYEALQWLKEREGIVIEEGCTQGVLCGYSYGGRVAVFTGNPAVIAWTNHEYQWRRNYELIAERAEDVRRFFYSRNCEEMREIVEKYNISYIFLGYEERRIFPIRDEVFENCFHKVFEKSNVKIFSTTNESLKKLE